jgi:signal recognition particle GTPase
MSLYGNIAAKKKRIAAGSGEKMRKVMGISKQIQLERSAPILL